MKKVFSKYSFLVIICLLLLVQGCEDTRSDKSEILVLKEQLELLKKTPEEVVKSKKYLKDKDLELTQKVYEYAFAHVDCETMKHMVVCGFKPKEVRGFCPMINIYDDEEFCKKAAEAIKLALASDVDVKNYERKDDFYRTVAYLGDYESVKYLHEEIGVDINFVSPIGTNLVHMAAYGGNLESVRYLVEHGVNVFAKDSDSENTLHYAARSGSLDCIKYLVGQGVDVKARTQSGKSMLHFRKANQSLECLKYLVDEHGLDVNATDSTGMTPLHCMYERSGGKKLLECVKYLVEKGADINRVSDDSTTILAGALACGDLESVKYLVEKGADLFKIQYKRNSALMLAIWSENIDLVRYVVSNGVDVNEITDKGKSAILILKDETLACPNMSFLFECYKILVEAGANIQIEDENGETIFERILETGDFEWIKYMVENHHVNLSDFNNKKENLLSKVNVNFNGWEDEALLNKKKIEIKKYLIEKGIEVNNKATDIEGRYFYEALTEEDDDYVVFLINQGADINFADFSDNSALHIAAERGLLKTLKLLVKNGLCISAENEFNETALHFAAENGNLECIKFLVSQGADINNGDNYNRTALHNAVKSSNIDCVRFLVESGADIHKCNKGGNTALHIAAECNFLDAVKYLIGKGADEKIVNYEGKGVLHCAASGAALDCMKFFIARGADVFSKSDFGNTLLHYGELANSVDCLRYLIEEKGLDVNALDNTLKSVLHYAAEKGNLECVKYLTERGAVVDRADEEGKTPFLYAVEGGFLECVKYLVEEKKADIFRRDVSHYDGLDFAYRAKSLSCFKYLSENGLDVTFRREIFHKIIEEGGPEDIVQYLIDKGKDVNSFYWGSYTALDYAINYNTLGMVEKLVENGADVNLHKKDNDSPIWIAAGVSLDKYEFLKEHGAKDKVHSEKELNERMLQTLIRNEKYEEAESFAKKHGLVFQLKKNKTLIDAIMNYESLESLQRMIQSGADVHIKDEEGYSVLSIAMSYEVGFNVMEFLIKNGCDVNEKDENGTTLLHRAARFDSVDYVRYLMNKGLDCNLKDKKGNTLLHYAAMGGSINNLKYLISLGLDVNEKNYMGETVLDCVSFEAFDCIRFLIEQGLKLEPQSQNATEMFHHAIYENNLEMVEFLLKQGVNIDCLDKDGDTVLKEEVTIYKRPRVIKFLIENGADINAKCFGNEPFFCLACQNLDLNSIKYLLAVIDKNHVKMCYDKSFNMFSNELKLTQIVLERRNLEIIKLIITKEFLDKCDAKQRHELLLCSLRNFEAFRYLCEQGLDYKYVDEFGDNYLFKTVHHDYQTLVYTVELGLDVNLRGKYGYTPFNLSMDYDNYEWDMIDPHDFRKLEFLAKNGGKLDCSNDLDSGLFLRGFCYMPIKTICAVLDHSVENKHKKEFFQRVLRAALRFKRMDVVDELLKRGAHYDEYTLYEVVNTGSLELIRKYEKMGFSFTPPHTEETVLHRAVMSNSLECFKYVLEKDVDINAKSGESLWSKTALHLAAEKGNSEMVHCLVKKGADIYVKDNDGNTPLQLAVDKKTRCILKKARAGNFYIELFGRYFQDYMKTIEYEGDGREVYGEDMDF